MRPISPSAIRSVYPQEFEEYRALASKMAAASPQERIELLRQFDKTHHTKFSVPLKTADIIEPAAKYRPSDKSTALSLGDSRVKAYLFPDGSGRESYITELRNLGAEVLEYDSVSRAYLLELPASRFEDLASLPWVKQLALEQPKKLQQAEFEPDDSRQLVTAPQVWQAGVTGTGVKVGVYDTGIWAEHPDFAETLVWQYNQETLSTSSAPDNHGHGTHVAGIIAGGGSHNIEGSYDAKGIAPGSELYVLRFKSVDSNGYVTTNTTDAFSRLDAQGVKIINNSWASDDDYSYGAEARIADSYVDNQGITIIFAAGNDGSNGSRTINDPGTGKNVITVGAISYTLGGKSGGIGKVATYSSRGPTRDDGRLKPELVAPGGDLSSGYYHKYGVVAPNAWYQSEWLDSAYSAYNRWASDPYYTRKAGTSMAAPHVAGVAALLYQQYQNSFPEGLYPRDITALLVANAIPLKGYGSNPANGYANTISGYGLVDALTATLDIAGEKETLLWRHGGLVNGIHNSQTFAIPGVDSSVKKLIAVLCYEDQEGQTSVGRALWDDLDMKLIAPNGTEFNFTLPQDVTSESPLEKIVVDNPSQYGSGNWSVQVVGDSWGDKLWGVGVQDYTVLVTAHKSHPALTINAPSALRVTPGQEFELSLSVENSGGLVAAGVTAEVSATASFGGEINHREFAGNLAGKGTAQNISFSLTAPSATGNYSLIINADAINMGLEKVTAIIPVKVAASLLAGDTNSDNNIDILDITLVAANFGTRPPDPHADINEDGEVNILDLSLVGLNYGRSIPAR